MQRNILDDPERIQMLGIQPQRLVKKHQRSVRRGISISAAISVGIPHGTGTVLVSINTESNFVVFSTSTREYRGSVAVLSISTRDSVAESNVSIGPSSFPVHIRGPVGEGDTTLIGARVSQKLF